jgi:twitching motility protein PilT
MGSRILDEILRKAVEVNATDVHLKVGLPPVVRVQDSIKILSKSMGPVRMDEVASICGDIVAERLRPLIHEGQEVDMAYSLSGVGRFRINIFRHRGQTAIIARFIPFEIRSLDELGLPKSIKNIALMTRGLILVTGTAGSGKSTTLAAMLNEWNLQKSGHILTIEDPVEYLLRDRKSIVTQREVGLDTENFSTGLKYALRQDPDVIMIGEMRDRETIFTALNAAETGHLVLSTLHTKDAAETLNRVIGVFPPESQMQVRYQLSAALSAIVSQRLVPSVNSPTGFAVASEIMVVTPRIRDCILNPERQEEISLAIQDGEQYGMMTFDQSLLKLIADGRISKEVGIQYASRPNDLELKLRGIS